MSKAIMKNLFALPAILAVTIFCSCQKQQTEAERNAEIERQVQQRLASEHQTQEQQQLAQRVAELEAQQKAAAEQKTTVATEQATEETERHPSTSASQRTRDTSENEAPADYSMFYSRLEPHGEWRQTSNYGYVWQPREAHSLNWRPYTNGRWVYTDAGWTWISEEPFGWATYHYGRWTRLRGIGWVWIPGDEWAPAWVSWRTSNDYVGWAPLPPEARFERASGIHNWADSYYDIGPEQYAFVRTNEFGQQRVDRAVLPTERNVTIVNETTNVTNITYNNTNIVNQGPSYDELSRRGAHPIERLHLERQVNVNFSPNDSRAVVRGDIVQMTAPVILRARTVERPRLVKENVTQVVVEHGWEGIADRQAADKVRMKMKSEATPPPNAPSRIFVKPVEAAATTVVSEPVMAPTAPVPPTAPTVARPVGKFIPVPIITPTPRSTIAASTTPASPATATVTASPFQPPMRHSGEELKREQRMMDQSQSPGGPSGQTSPAAGATVSPSSPAASNSPNEMPPKRGKFQSEALKRNPRLVVPMTSPAPSSSPAGASSPAATAAAESSPAGEPSRKEERKPRKGEQRQGVVAPGAASSPSATPQ
jgi:hypothetical protein